MPDFESRGDNMPMHITNPLVSALAKGILEGITEFLPISSTGHLVLVREWFPLAASAAERERLDNLFDIVVQFPAILAIVVLYRTRLKQAVQVRNIHFAKALMIAFIPLAVLGVLIKKKIEIYLMAPHPIAWALIVGGVVLLALEPITRWFQGRRKKPTVDSAELTPLKTALGIGLAQCLALIPGTSRSAATLVGGMCLGLTRSAAAEFSFFLAIPVMGAAFGYQFLKSWKTIEWCTDLPILWVGSVASFFTAWLVVALFIRYLKKNSLALFGWYRIVLGAVVLFWM